MSYRVLALKYRPQNFQDVIGQPHVTQTLSNAIASHRVAHAILFSGPRGTGKTSIARILAKAVNCEKGPTPTPCNRCRSCRDITAGNAADVFEIDGASNNSVDQIRELRENVTYMPVSSPRKIYIIDEVHMLSTAAFNALLKTLEEPPDHVQFIFATTEPHKIPITILSRCQRHNLGRITTSEIARHLTRICTGEAVEISQESLHLIASEADGSMRDSLSLLDRVISSSTEPRISHAHILNNLGIIDRKILMDMAAAVFRQDGAAILDNISRVNDLGFDLKKIYAGLVETFRNIQVVQLCGNSDAVSDISPHDREQIAALSTPGGPGYPGQLLAILLKEEQLIRFSSHTRTALETILLQLIQVPSSTEVESVINRLDALARHVKNNAASPSAGAAVTARSPEKATTALRCGEQTTPYPATQIHRHHDDREALPPGPESGVNAPAPRPLSSENISRTGQPDVQHTRPGEKQTSREQPTWEGFLKRLSSALPFISAILSKSTFQGITNGELRVSLSGNSNFDFKRIQSKQGRVEDLCREYFGNKTTLKLIRPDKEPTATRTDQESTPAQKKQAAMNHPLVTDAVERFNGQIVDIQLK